MRAGLPANGFGSYGADIAESELRERCDCTAYGTAEVRVLDPLKGERLLPLQTFNTAWALRHNLAIIVER